MWGIAGVAAGAAVASYTDVTRGRIPNVLVALLFCYGLALAAYGGAERLVVGLALAAAVFAAGAVLFSLRLIGGGDVKFLSAAAVAIGWPGTLEFLLYTVLAGGLLGIAVAARRGRVRDLARNVGSLALPLLSGVRPGAPAATAGKMPYALAILTGALTLALGNLFAFHLRIPL